MLIEVYQNIPTLQTITKTLDVREFGKSYEAAKVRLQLETYLIEKPIPFNQYNRIAQNGPQGPLMAKHHCVPFSLIDRHRAELTL